MIKIAVTFDYELFLGKNSGSSEEILFEPTERLLKLLNKYGIKATFFADVCSITAHKKYNSDTYIRGFEHQISNIIESGHDVQLHIHPNWLFSEMNNDGWSFDTSHYRLSDFEYDNNTSLCIRNIIMEGKTYLEQILQTVKKEYKCIAFRAGGYSLQPHSEIVTALREQGIIIDSSICAGQYIDTLTNRYDYRVLPKTLNWWLTPKMAMDYMGTANQNGVFEVSIPSDKNSVLKRIMAPWYTSQVRVSEIKGEFISTGVTSQTHKCSIFERLSDYSRHSAILTLDSMPSKRMLYALQKISKYHNNENPYIALIGHPKLIDEGVLRNMECVFDSLRKSDEYKTVTMRQIYDEIKQ